MPRLTRAGLLVLVATIAVCAPALVPAAAIAAPLPDDGCELVDVEKLDATLGVKTEPGTTPPLDATASQEGVVGCLLPIPYDAATCIVQPAPAVLVGAGKLSGSEIPLAQAAKLAESQGFEVVRLHGKAYGRKGAFLLGGTGWTFFGTKGPHAVQIAVSDPCGSVPSDRQRAAAKLLARGVMRQL